MAEAVNGLYKAEIIHSRRIWPSVTVVGMATMDWVQWWNTHRLHESLDYQTPVEAELAYTQDLILAPAMVYNGTKPRALHRRRTASQELRQARYIISQTLPLTDVWNQ